MYSKITIEDYNVYLVGNVLINTVPERLSAKLTSQLSKVRYIILTSSDPDTSGAVGAVLDKFPDAVVLASGGCIRNVKEILNRDFSSYSVKDKEQYLGFTFHFTPGFIWPDSLVAEYGDALFSGHMYSHTQVEGLTEYRNNHIEGRYYAYANEVVAQLLKATYLPSRGDEVLAESVCEYFSAYENTQKYIAIVYTSTYGYTKELADIAYNASLAKYPVKLISADFSNAVDMVNNASALMIGTPTVNRAMPNAVKSLLINADTDKLHDKPCMVFGSYGWSGEALSSCYSILKALRADVFEKPFRCPLRISDDRRKEFIEYIDRFLGELENAEIFC